MAARKPAAKTPAASKSARPSRPPRQKPAAKAETKKPAARAEKVLDGVRRDLEELGEIPGGAGLAASALELARQMDNRGNSATSKSMCSKALLDTLDRLRELKPPSEHADRVTHLEDVREARRGHR